ncbi:hypothetical protein Pan153_11830 [Gimesia panareensis]|uniref:Uncharacterized protein n=1 Tax=Gimesia panareensis TaxID=2527978 RepID=A0A518FJT7_9PLAN|nr:hypothetical protein Pan153_11830 [Gimesia panareensis]
MIKGKVDLGRIRLVMIRMRVPFMFMRVSPMCMRMPMLLVGLR